MEDIQNHTYYTKPPPYPVGNYDVDINPELGRGSYGVALYAQHNLTKQRCVVKKIDFTSDTMRSGKMQGVAETEWTILRSLQHKNIVKYLDVVRYSTVVWIFLEFCNLGNLKEYIMKRKNLHIQSKLDIKLQCAEALEYLHSKNITHRAIKLENYLVTKSQEKDVVKLTDFGLSKMLEGNSSELSMTKNRGTMLYRSPEQFRGDRYSKKVDIFGLGLVFLVIFDYGQNCTFTIPLSGNYFIVLKIIPYLVEQIQNLVNCRQFDTNTY